MNNRRFVWGVILVLVLFLSGCTLIDWVGGSLYFYSMDLGGSETLLARKNGYTVIMSRGEDGIPLSKEDAEKLKETTKFELILDEDTLHGDSITVDELKDGWHVVQDFSTGALKRGTYMLTGTTTGEDGFSRTDKVKLRVR